jgi:acetyl-CoA carboxylase biotin carboxyl carrier protein
VTEDTPDLERVVSQVRAIVDLLESKGVSRFRMRWGALDLALERAPAADVVPPSGVAVAPAPSTGPAEAQSPAAEAEANASVRAPLVGVFYRRPAPEQPPFVEVGQRIDVGQQLAVVEAMKMFNPITSPVAGLVVDIPVADGEVVEFDQVLMTVQP